MGNAYRTVAAGPPEISGGNEDPEGGATKPAQALVYPALSGRTVAVTSSWAAPSKTYSSYRVTFAARQSPLISWPCASVLQEIGVEPHPSKSGAGRRTPDSTAAGRGCGAGRTISIAPLRASAATAAVQRARVKTTISIMRANRIRIRLSSLRL